MGTLNTAIGKIRLRINENKVQFYSDSDLVSLINDQVRYAYNLMKNVECKALVNSNEIVLVAGTEEYIITDNGGIVSAQVFNINGDRIPLYSEFLSETFSYTQSALGIKFYNFVDGDEVVVKSWKTLVELDTASLSTADLPFDGYWDDAIVRVMIVECQEIREHDNSRTSVFANTASEDALYAVCERYGLIARTMRGSLNV